MFFLLKLWTSRPQASRQEFCTVQSGQTLVWWFLWIMAMQSTREKLLLLRFVNEEQQ